jgi:integration host factor subunit alpha
MAATDAAKTAAFQPSRFDDIERMVMTKADIVENVYEKVGGFSKKEAAEIVETVFDTIKETLERGEKIKISGFGNFVVRDKNARAGRNPQTGQEITISARRVLTFKPSQVLKNVLND